MATGMAAAFANAALDALFRNTSFAVMTAYIQLHTGDPGANGTLNVAMNNTRKALSMSPASGGAITNSAAITWTTSEVTAAEDYTHCTIWSASTGGTFYASGLVTASAVSAGDEFTIPAGDLDFSFTLAS